MIFQILEQANFLLEDINNYGAGASAQVRVAIQWPNNVNFQAEALEILEKLISRIRTYYDLSQRLEKIVPMLLWELCSGRILFI